MSFKAVNQTRKKKLTKEFFYSWEMILVYLLIAINILLMIFVNDVYFGSGNIQTIIRCGMEISFMVLGMTFILILGEIDVSVASIMLVSAMVMGLTYENMVGSSGEAAAAITSVLMGVLAGGCCGLLNGFLVAIVKMPSVITTIGTSFLFRGIVHAVLGGDFKSNFPKFFEPLAWDDIGGAIPISLIAFLLFAILFIVILQHSKFGRQLYLVGNNKETANYSGIRVAKTKIIAFVIMGMTAALSAIIFVGRLGGIDYTMATGYELKVIAVVVLGGVSTLGGKGKMYGPIIATFFMAFLLKSLDLFGVQQNVQKIAIGIILILAILTPRINRKSLLKFKLNFTRPGIRQIEGTDIPHNIEEAKKKLLDEEHRMSSKEFYEFINKLSVTTNPINRTIHRENVKLAINEYKTQNAILRKISKKKNPKKYALELDKLNDKRIALEKMKDEYALNTYVRNKETSTIHKLLKMNKSLVKDEINGNAKEHIRNYRLKHYVLTDNQLTDYLNNLQYSSWIIKDINLKNVKDAFNEFVNKQKALDKARIKRNFKLIHEAVIEKEEALISFYIFKTERDINTYLKAKINHVNNSIKTINKKNQEIKCYEKK